VTPARGCARAAGGVSRLGDAALVVRLVDQPALIELNRFWMVCRMISVSNSAAEPAMTTLLVYESSSGVTNM
ncbi:hypothetical protein ACWF9G_17720, partial [Nocardia sp. NPDC055029]